ncbi:hypothetical protein GCM10020295_05010 [Streptomyces cinereospinus]
MTPSTSVRTSMPAGTSAKARSPAIWTVGGDSRWRLASPRPAMASEALTKPGPSPRYQLRVTVESGQ